MNVGKKTEEFYQSLFIFRCPRSKKGIFEKCLMTNWGYVIDDVFSKLLKELPEPKLNQIIKGRTGNREFNQEKLDEIITIIERLVNEELRLTEAGYEFYREGKQVSIKALTFCVFNCCLLKTAKEKWNLSYIKTKILNKLFFHYYIEGAEIDNSSIQTIEKQINIRDKKLREKLSVNEIGEISEDVESAINGWDSFNRGEADPIVLVLDNAENEINAEKSLFTVKEQLDFFNVEDYFLEGDQELTDTLIDYCQKNERRDITCNVFDKTYWVAARKIIHLFLHENEKFKHIDLSAECLAEQKVDVNELRRLVELAIRKRTSWELTREERNKFILCTICHLIRHFKLLGKLDTLDGIKAFFKYKGEIYELSENVVDQEYIEVIKRLQLDESKVIEMDLTKAPSNPQQEKVKTNNFSENNRIEDLKQYFKKVAETVDYKSLLPMEIADLKSKARELLNPEEGELSSDWVDIIKQHSSDQKLFPFIAELALKKLEQVEATEMKDLDLESYKKECQECMKTVDLEECQKNSEQVLKAITKGEKAIQKLWKEREDLRPCIANRLDN